MLILNSWTAQRKYNCQQHRTRFKYMSESPWGCFWLTAPPEGLLLLLFDIENLDMLVSLDPVILPCSHTLSSTHSLSLTLSLPSSFGSQVRPVPLKNCQCVSSGYELVDLTDKLRCEECCSCIRELCLSLKSEPHYNVKSGKIKTRLWLLFVLFNC